MNRNDVLYKELIEMASRVGFDIKHKFANYKVLALELGDFLNGDRCEVVKNHDYYKSLFEDNAL